MGTKHTKGDWDWAVDSYGKVRHSRKYSCVYTTHSSPDGDRLVSIAARIENVNDARLIAAAPALLASLKVLADFVASELEGDDSHPFHAALASANDAIGKAER